jgi:hypothetical protein
MISIVGVFPSSAAWIRLSRSRPGPGGQDAQRDHMRSDPRPGVAVAYAELDTSPNRSGETPATAGD